MPINQDNLKKLIEMLATMKIGFIGINHYTNQHGEVSKRRINIGFNWDKLKKEDLATLEAGVEYIPSERYTKADWDMAIVELKESIVNPSKTRSESQSNAYLTMTENGAVRYNYNTQKLYVMGLELDGSKKVVEEGEDDNVKSKPKTIAKNVIKRNYLKQGLIRNFTVYKIGEVRAMGEEIEIL